MKNQSRLLHGARLILLPALALSIGTTMRGQTAAAPAPDARTLVKYDANRNGRLDPDEVATMQADEARAAAAVATTGAAAAPARPGDDTVTLSPFEVKEANNGYYATNTMSGTRLNTKLEDIGASISVITKAQMQDFAMLDINDIFAYETSTEGTSNYTSFEIDRNGMVTDQIQNNPQGANRVRGISSANISLSGFATSGRAPVDPSSIDAVEISRGPNSSIFGIGEGSGTVNLVASTANFSRETTSAEFRADDVGGWRTSIDVNRPIIKGKLGARVSAVYQHDEYRQKPSGFENRRLNAMLRFQPFKDTTLRASFNSYHGVGTRATAVTPRDGISYWKSLGSPAWDPTMVDPTNPANTARGGVTVNGVTTFMGNTTPTGLGGQNFGDPIVFVDGGIKLWMVSQTPAATATDGPNNRGGVLRMLETQTEDVRAGRPLFSTRAGVSSRDVYDYSSINLAAPNTIKDQVETTTIEFEQFLLNTDRNKIAFQLAWQREDADRINRNVVGGSSATGSSYYLYVDPNSKLLDGRPNPYFGRPYIGAGEPVHTSNPYVRDAYRGQGAYILDFTNSDKWYKWIGKHQFLGYYEERKSKSFSYRFRDVMISPDNPVYAPAGRPKANQSGTAAPIATRPYFHFYAGDANGANVDTAPSGYSTGNYPFTWYNTAGAGYPANSWVTENVVFGASGINEGVAGSFAVLNLIKTKGSMLQSYLLDERVILTFGKRHDENRNKGQRPSVLRPNGYEFDYAAMDGWVGDWALREGDTKTSGFVVKPFRNWGFINRARSSGGAGGWLGEVLNGLTIYYNKSDSFKPEPPAIDILAQELPNPFSEGKDYGFTLNIGNKLVLRANKYETKAIKSRAGESGTLATRTGRIDFAPFKGENDAMALQRQASNWLRAADPTLATDPTRLNAAVANVMKLDPSYLANINASVVTDSSDAISRGNEYEVAFNPNSYWTLRANLARQEAINANLSPIIPAWIAQRMPVWTTIIDPRATNPGADATYGTADDSLGYFWFQTGYSGDAPNATGGGTRPATFLLNNVLNPLAIAQATEGKKRPQTREWRFNLNTSYRLAGITENKYLKRMSVGGAVRWESKGAIGYYGVPVNGDIHRATALDPDRPIYDKANANFDAFVTYTTRLFKDKVRARFQLNVRDIQESRAHLQPVGAYPNGVAHTFRIINPRTFIFSSTFDL